MYWRFQINYCFTVFWIPKFLLLNTNRFLFKCGQIAFFIIRLPKNIGHGIRDIIINHINNIFTKMKYNQIDRQLFIKNRAKFTAQMKPNSLAVFNSNDIYPVSADSTLPFAQHRDILYLSGVDQEESILLLFPDAPYENQREMLFLKETSEHIAIWEGEKLSKDRAFEVSGIKTVYWLQDFEKVLFEMMTHCDAIYINTNEHYRATIETETREARFVKWWKAKYPAHAVAKSNPILQRIRSIKETE